jgi:membrane fusion protein (multidrug efflux system)
MPGACHGGLEHHPYAMAPLLPALQDFRAPQADDAMADEEVALAEGQELRRDTDGGSGDGREGAPAPRATVAALPRKGRRRAVMALAALVLVGALIGGGYWYLTLDQEATDDAFIDGDVIHVGPQVSGQILALHITDNQRVQQGDLLIEIDPRDFVTARDQAGAALAVARAQAENARINLEMVEVTAPARLAAAKARLAGDLATMKQAELEAERQSNAGPRATSQNAIDTAVANARSAAATVDLDRAQVEMQQLVQQDIDQAKAEIDQLEAQARQAEAQLAQAELNLSYTKIRAPADGIVTGRAVNVGDIVQRGQTLTDLVIGVPWVIANFKEDQLTHMRPGQPVDIAIDAYPDEAFKGHVDSIQAGTGARFSLLPPENATGNYVKVVQRVPVKIVFDGPENVDRFLALGMSVVPTVDVGARPRAAEHATGATSPEPGFAATEAAR